MRLPLTFDPVSNGEFVPPPKSETDAAMERAAEELVARGMRRRGQSRREFLTGSCGMAACLLAIDRVGAQREASFVLPPEALLDPDAASAVLDGDEFIFDIQTHHVLPGGAWEEQRPAMKRMLRLFPGGSDYGRRAFVKEIFLDSDTTCAVLSAVPAHDDASQPLPQREAEETRAIVEKLAGTPRLWVHALVVPNVGDLQERLDEMERIKERYPIAAWKVYTLYGPRGRGWWLDDEKVGIPFIEKARELGIERICMHKGFPGFGVRGGYERPRDVGVVAKRFPDVDFIVYHSGFDPRIREAAYDPDTESDRGIDALIRSLDENEIGPNQNVYAELGSTWWVAMRRPQQAPHVIGKLLKHVGHDNVLWGTDCIWYGSPQPQIAAFRAFQIPERLREAHGYPELTRELKAKVFGLNAAEVYGIEVQRDLPEIHKDEVEKLKHAYLPERDPSHRVYGPRTRREFMALWRARGGMMA